MRHTVRRQQRFVTITSRRKLTSTLLIACALEFSFAGIAGARVDSGRRAFGRYCATCHGEDGAGNGPMRPALKAAPTDLTKLNRSRAGFPRADLLRVLENMKPITAHGSADLPVWGETFWRAAGEEGLDRSPQSQTMEDIADFVESLQSSRPGAAP